MLDPLIFECFMSRAVVNGKETSIGVADSIAIKRQAILRGFTGEDGSPRENLSWLEELVINLRAASTAEEFNHEWWAAEISKPDWVRNLDRIYGEGWLYFPEQPSDLTAAKIGSKVGYSLTLYERQMSQASSDQEYLAKWEESELEEARRELPPEDAAKVRIAIPGHDSFANLASSVKGIASKLRQAVMEFVEQQGLEQSHQFREAFSKGAKKAFGIDLAEHLSEFNRQAKIIEVLSEEWNIVADFKNRAELCRFICTRFPKHARERLEAEQNTRADVGMWKNFTEQVRDVCDKIELKLAGRGRPPKNTDSAET